ncbi:hypothetical protein Tco_1214162 [Tanacetum coccineum]
MADHSQKWHNKTSTRTRSTDTSDELAAIQAQLNNLGREIKKVNEIVYAAQVGCESCVLFPQRGRYRAAALGFYQRDNVNPSYQGQRQIMEESLRKLRVESAKKHYENSNLINEIRASTDAAIRNQGASIKALKIQIGEMSKVLQEKGSGCLPSSIEMNPRDHVKSISTTIEADMSSIRQKSATNLKKLLREKPRMGYRIKASRNVHDSAILEDSLPPKEKDPWTFTIPCYINNICFKKALADLGASVSVMPYSTFTNLDFIILDMPEDIKVLLILKRHFLSTAHAKIDVFKRKFSLRVGDDKIVFKSNNPTSSIIRRVYALGLRERIEPDLEARLMGEALILNGSPNPVYGDYIESNDLNKPLELRRNQVEDLCPTIEEGEVINEPMDDIIKTRNDDNEISNRIDEYPSFCDFDRKNHIDCAYNMQFSCIIVIENMDAYRDEGMGDVIVGKPFCREICIKARRFDGMITIYNGNNSVTYKMTRSHPRFKYLTNVQCNKMRPLLKVIAQDKLNEISHPYQKLKSFYKGVLNLGPEYIRDAKIKELLIRGHVSIHEI